MIGCIIISSLTAVSVMLSILIKPYINIGKYKVGLYWIISLLGALITLLFGIIPLKEALNGITQNTAMNPLKILVLFLSMTIISIFLGDAGFFDYVAQKIIEKSDGNKIKFFVSIYFVAAILTIFTSNDIIILTFTPPICIFCKRAKISPIPYLFGEFVAANTFSITLIIGNPTNIYLATGAGFDFFFYLSKMFLPALLSGIVGFGILFLIFRKDLTTPFEKVSQQIQVKIQKLPMIFSLVVLITCIVLLAVSDFINIQMWLICLISAGILIVIQSVYHIWINKTFMPIIRVIKKAPFEIVPFVLSMFIISLSLSYNGITDAVKDALINNSFTDGIVFGYLSAFFSNLLNNIPMSVLFEKVVSGSSNYAIFGTIIGSNIGAFITPVGALAGIMWNRILSEHGFHMSFAQFVKYGLICSIPILIISTLSLAIIL